MTWKRLATKCYTIQLLWEKARLLCYVIFHVKLVADELRLKPFNNLCLTFRICPSSGYWSKIFFNCWISDGWIRLKPEEKPSLVTYYIGFLARISRVMNYLKCCYHRNQLLFLSLSLLSQLWQNAYFTYSFPEQKLWLRKTSVNYKGENNNNNDDDDNKMEWERL